VCQDDQDWHDDPLDQPTHASSEEEQKLQMNAKIGTALMLKNSHRALVIMYVKFDLVVTSAFQKPHTAQ
jgi:hypothetical protein